MNDDAELLRRYANEQSEAAFAELVRRHVDLVYSAALRLVNDDAHRAQDITQQVFAEFARQAKRLVGHPAPVGWLYTTTRRSALRVIRTEKRRSVREQEATAMNELIRESTSDPEWEHLRPVLEDVMHELGETDRHAVLLRFFQNKSLRDVGLALDMGENAARMRVDRALEKLRAAFSKRGVATTSALATAISAHAVQLAPAGLAGTLATTSLAGAGAGVGALTLFKIMTATQVKIGIGALVVAGATTVMVMQHEAQAKLAGDNDALRQQIAKLQDDLSKATNVVAAADPQPPSKDQLDELLRLRGQVGVLRQQLEMQKVQAAGSAGANAATPIRAVQDHFMTRDQVSDAGFATPEAAFQTFVHGMLNTNYEATVKAMASQIRVDAGTNFEQKEDFEKQMSGGALTNFLGQEIVAKKILGDDRVELEVLKFMEGEAPDILVQHMVKEGDEWKFAGATKLSDNWRNDGQFERVDSSAGQ